MTGNGGGAPSAEDLRKHLDFIQAVVTRMSAASSAAKGWLLPVVTATYGYALTKHAESVALLGLLSVALFAFLDANYLRQEQGYRALYDAVAKNTRPVPLFSLAIEDAFDPFPAPATPWGRAKGWMRKWFPGRRVWCSWSIAPFYGLLFVVGVVVFFVAR
ncbi:hypothetical protein [Luteococcus japonicus]|uniref:hypothetical protein n=1 Tax=Luteococcus japonicus TaxID=33984 RepID=UPI000B9A58F2|nr:hypothetical protein [Luteococcus japonicus]